MRLMQTAIPDLVIVEPLVFHDNRGWFKESFNEKQFRQELAKLNLPAAPRFVQDNHSCSQKNVLRGLHYQLSPHSQGKLVQVVKGSAFDVAVDIRQGSRTFGQHVSVLLSGSNHRLFWIPEGFAHGFLTLEEDTHFIYKTTDFYHKDFEAAIRFDDPQLAIRWPIEETPLVNEKDLAAPFFEEAIMMAFQAPVNGWVDLPVFEDTRGALVALENTLPFLFPIERIYYIFDTQPAVSRGFHAHKNLSQLVVCVSGRCRIVLDDGKTRKSWWLESPRKGLLIHAMTWREMHDFSPDCVLVVLASEKYEEQDYIRDYSRFQQEIAQLQR